MNSTLLSTISLEQYLEQEEHAQVKHEFVDGQLYAMAGASKTHIRLMLNIARYLESKESCEVYTSDLKVIIAEPPKVTYYPDVVVVCEDELETHSTSKPCFIVEVLSDSTKRIDLTEKKTNYQRIDSLKAYMIVHQDQQFVELHRRLEDNTWQLEQYTNGEIEIPCPSTTLTLEQIYAGIGGE
jgi:Uma2 family endonuclease